MFLTRNFGGKNLNFNLKNSIIIFLLISILLSLSAVSAEDSILENNYGLSETNGENIDMDCQLSENDNLNSQLSENDNLDSANFNSISSNLDESIFNEEDNLKVTSNSGLKDSGSSNSFDDIQTIIDGSDSYGIIELDGTYTSSGNVIKVNKTLTIIGSGDGATFDANSISRIFEIEADNVILQNLRLINANSTANTAGPNQGAVYINGSDVSVINCTFINNVGSGNQSYGGAIRWAGTNGKIIDSRFINNSAYRAGAVQVTASGFSINGSEFIDNYGSYQEGGLFLAPGAGDSIVENCTFNNNSANGLCGALRACSDNNRILQCIFINNHAGTEAGAVLSCNAGNYFENCIFINNSATQGAAIFFKRTGNEVNKCLFLNNSADDGAAIYNNQSNAVNTVRYSIFDGNVVTGKASACYGEGNCLIANFFGKNYGSDSDILSSNLIYNGTAYQAPSSWANIKGETLFYNKLNNIESLTIKFVLNNNEDLEDILPDYTVSLSNANSINQLGSGIVSISNNSAQFDYLTNGAIDDVIQVKNINNDAIIYSIDVYFVKKTPTLTVEVPDINEGENLTVHIYLTCGDDKLSNVELSGHLDDGFEFNLMIFNGETVYTYGILPSGQHNITFNFQGNEEYNPVNSTASFNVIKSSGEDPSEKEHLIMVAFANPNPINYGENITFYVAVYSCDDFNDSAILIINGKERVINIVNSQAAIIITNLNAGLNNLTLFYGGNDKYYNKSIENIVEVNKLSTKLVFKNMTVKSVDTKIDGKIGQYFSFTLKDVNGKVLDNKKVQIKLNGVIYNLKTDKNGIAKLQINLKAVKTYTVYMSFAGDGNYEKVSASAKITVKKQSFKLYTSNKSYKLKAKTKKLTATLKSSKGKYVKGKKITFKVNGKTYSAKTNSKGVATVKVNLNKKKTYKFTVKYAGDSTVNAITKSAKIRIY